MKKMATRIFLLFVGLLLAAYAVLAPTLNLVGVRTTGTITEVRRQHGERNEAVPNRYEYGVGYHFVLPDGRKIHGSATVVGNSYSAGIAKGPTPVRYLAAWPRINMLERETRFNIAHLIIGGVGILMVVLAFKRAKGARRPKKAPTV